MNKWLCILMAGVLTVAFVAPVQAQDEGAAGATAEAQQVTQGELARMLVDVLGLYRFLPPRPTVAQCVTLLLENGLEPEEGWMPDEPVTRADLARLVVQAMDREYEVENPDDPRSWIALLSELGVSLDSIGAATDQIEPTTEPVAPHVFKTAGTVDPLLRERIGLPDETEFGADASLELTTRPVTPEEVRIALSRAASTPFEPEPITPD